MLAIYCTILKSIIVMEEQRVDSDQVDKDQISNGTKKLCEQTLRECAICGDGNGKIHYGVLSCFGCKGFFRRALRRTSLYTCNKNRNCIINKLERNSCRYCRLQKCLDVGMNPDALRPDRDFTGPQYAIRTASKRNEIQFPEENRELSRNDMVSWKKRLPVEMRIILMKLLNIEAKTVKGDTNKKASEIYPFSDQISLRELLNDPSKLEGLRSEMRYEPYRMTENSELVAITYRRLIAAIDWVSSLSDMVVPFDTDDKIALVKNCFAPLLVFAFTVRTAEVTEDPDVLCMCTFSYVPRDVSSAYADAYHLSNGLVGQALDELVAPMRSMKLLQEEIVCIEALIVLNPHAKDLSLNALQETMELRNRIQDTLFHVIKERRSKENAHFLFGKMLLLLPTITIIANSMCENLQFAQTFSPLGSVALLTNLFGCFPVEPFNGLSTIDYELNIEEGNEEKCISNKGSLKSKDVSIQTDPCS